MPYGCRRAIDRQHSFCHGSDLREQRRTPYESFRTTGHHMNENRSQDVRESLAAPLTLRSGPTLANRLAKAATSEHLADPHGAPTNQLVTAYRTLAQSGAGLLISGNVMVDGSSLEGPRNVVIEDDSHNEELRRWAASTEGTEAKLILQLSHPGRQTMRGNVLPGRRQDVVGPSSVPLTVGGSGFFRPPRALSDTEITVIIGRFARAAQVAADTGFHGVEIHAAHGYLFNQFLSPLVNQRTDRWGGSLENRMRLLVETVRAIRAATPDQFLVAVKLNSADFQRGGFDSDDSLIVARALAKEGIDFLEISGGTYESAAMVTGTPQRESTRAREAYFLEFAERFAQEVSVPLMLTGGFRTRKSMNEALDSGAVDIVGLARPITYEPDLPRRLLDASADKSLVVPKALGHKTTDDLLNSAWHQQQIARMGRGRPVRPSRSPAAALVIAALTTARDLLLPWLAPR
ncbi:NADH:flavin oxidoreductase/NADH oxidase family protein [Streptomyces sp. NPDC056653]|uniref:NADH:flavin oxidoreductase/NADH oxidase family protein n=1 Tax=Streptomyces sp. NPDC056653 TaxID=3345894 RepID=UPI003699B4D0